MLKEPTRTALTSTARTTHAALTPPIITSAMQSADAASTSAPNAAAERPPDDRYGVRPAGEVVAAEFLVAEIGPAGVTWLRGAGLATDPAPPPLTLASLAAAVEGAAGGDRVAAGGDRVPARPGDNTGGSRPRPRRRCRLPVRRQRRRGRVQCSLSSSTYGGQGESLVPLLNLSSV